MTRLLQPLGFLRFHLAILIPPTVERLLVDLQALNHLANRLSRRDHRIRFTQLLDDLLRIVLLAFHRESSALGYVTPADRLAGRQAAISAQRDQKLAAARERRAARR